MERRVTDAETLTWLERNPASRKEADYIPLGEYSNTGRYIPPEEDSKNDQVAQLSRWFKVIVVSLLIGSLLAIVGLVIVALVKSRGSITPPKAPPAPPRPVVNSCNNHGSIPEGGTRCDCDAGWGTADCGLAACTQEDQCQFGEVCDFMSGLCRKSCFPEYPYNAISGGGLCPDGEYDCGGLPVYACVCSAGWAGSKCDVCADNWYSVSADSQCSKYCEREATCWGNGECQGDGSCKCNPDYYPSDDCSVHCVAAMKCQGRGVCGEEGDCVCSPPYYGSICGTFCDAALNCSSSGYCGSMGTCHCNETYYGDDCSIRCYSALTCNGHGECDEKGQCKCDTNFQGDSCQDCQPGLYGPACDIRCDPQIDCGGAGYCNSDGNCVCTKESHYGPNCAYCNATEVCSGHGACTSLSTCHCDDNWFGPACATHCDPREKCSGNGHCSEDGTSCVCTQDYYTPSCNVFCNATVCNYHGTCDQETGACECTGGVWTGPYCNSCPPHQYGPECNTTCIANTTCADHGTCGSDGSCLCNTGFAQPSCNTCLPDYYSPACDQYCNNNITCSNHGSCKVENVQVGNNTVTQVSCECEKGYDTTPNCGVKSAETTLQGVILSGTSGGGLVANISAKSGSVVISQQETLTDGRFSLKDNLFPGYYDVIVNRPGYAEATMPFYARVDGSTQTESIVLSPQDLTATQARVSLWTELNVPQFLVTVAVPIPGPNGTSTTCLLSNDVTDANRTTTCTTSDFQLSMLSPSQTLTSLSTFNLARLVEASGSTQTATIAVKVAAPVRVLVGSWDSTGSRPVTATTVNNGTFVNVATVNLITQEVATIVNS